MIDHRLTDREWAEEWKHLDNVRIGAVAMFDVHHFFVSMRQHPKAVQKRKQGAGVCFSAKDDEQMTGRAASVPSE